MTLAEVDAAVYGSATDLDEHELDAAYAWWCLRELLGGEHPELPEMPGASESARCVFALLAAAGERVVPDPLGVLMAAVGFPDEVPAEGVEVSSWRVLAASWFDDAIAELVYREKAIRLGDGSLLLEGLS